MDVFAVMNKGVLSMKVETIWANTTCLKNFTMMVRDCRGLSNPHGSGTRVGTSAGTGMDFTTRHV